MMKKNTQSGISVIEVLLATSILLISSLGIMALVSTAIATNNRNKIDSTGTILAQSVLEQIKATIIGSNASSLTDCAGTLWTINTIPGGAALSASGIDFGESSPPANYHMNYVVKSPCSNSGVQATTYDVRWHVDIVGAPSAPTNTYLITVGARMQGHGEGNMLFSLPINLRVMVGN